VSVSHVVSVGEVMCRVEVTNSVCQLDSRGAGWKPEKRGGYKYYRNQHPSGNAGRCPQVVHARVQWSHLALCRTCLGTMALLIESPREQGSLPYVSLVSEGTAENVPHVTSFCFVLVLWQSRGSHGEQEV